MDSAYQVEVEALDTGYLRSMVRPELLFSLMVFRFLLSQGIKEKGQSVIRRCRPKGNMKGNSAGV